MAKPLPTLALANSERLGRDSAEGWRRCLDDAGFNYIEAYSPFPGSVLTRNLVRAACGLVVFNRLCVKPHERQVLPINAARFAIEVATEYKLPVFVTAVPEMRPRDDRWMEQHLARYVLIEEGTNFDVVWTHIPYAKPA